MFTKEPSDPYHKGTPYPGPTPGHVQTCSLRNPLVLIPYHTGTPYPGPTPLDMFKLVHLGTRWSLP